MGPLPLFLSYLFGALLPLAPELLDSVRWLLLVRPGRYPHGRTATAAAVAECAAPARSVDSGAV